MKYEEQMDIVAVGQVIWYKSQLFSTMCKDKRTIVAI